MIVLDSSFLVAFHNARDVHHKAAVSAMNRLIAGEWGEALLPEYVLVEVVTVIAARCAPATAITVGERRLRAREITFVPCSPQFHASVATFRDVAAAGLSFVEAAILTIARNRGVSEIVTFDRNFGKVQGVTLVP